MKFEQPRLPYSIDALQPVISPTTIDYHYGKHERAYIDTLNKLIEGTPYADMSLEDIIVKSDGKLFNNASQAWNHIFYFFQFAPLGLKEPNGILRDKIDSTFGSFDEFKKNLKKPAPPSSARDGYGCRPTQTANCTSLSPAMPAIL